MKSRKSHSKEFLIVWGQSCEDILCMCVFAIKVILVKNEHCILYIGDFLLEFNVYFIF